MLKRKFLILVCCSLIFVSCKEKASQKEPHESRPGNMKTSEGTKAKTKVLDLLQIDLPLPNHEVSSPLHIKGKARGSWFFEASAPVILLDKDNKVLARGHIEARGNWMTDDFVPFSGRLQFTAPDDERAYLVFKKANPSGKPGNDMEFRLPVLFPTK